MGWDTDRRDRRTNTAINLFPFLALCPTVDLGPAAIVKATEVDRPTFPTSIVTAVDLLTRSRNPQASDSNLWSSSISLSRNGGQPHLQFRRVTSPSISKGVSLAGESEEGQAWGGRKSDRCGKVGLD